MHKNQGDFAAGKTNNRISNARVINQSINLWRKFQQDTRNPPSFPTIQQSDSQINRDGDRSRRRAHRNREGQWEFLSLFRIVGSAGFNQSIDRWEQARNLRPSQWRPRVAGGAEAAGPRCRRDGGGRGRRLRQRGGGRSEASGAVGHARPPRVRSGQGRLASRRGRGRGTAMGGGDAARGGRRGRGFGASAVSGGRWVGGGGGGRRQ
jgi:hypothetical protein